MSESSDQNKGCFSFLLTFNSLLLVVMVLIRYYFTANNYLDKVKGPFNILTAILACGVLASIIYIIILIKDKGAQAIFKSMILITPGILAGLSVGSMYSGLWESASQVSQQSCLQRISPGGDLQKCDLQGADLAGVDLQSANLSDADLSGANLSEANLEAANLSWANLTETNFASADLNAANLSHARMVSTNLGGATLDQAIFDFVDPQDTKGLYGNTSRISSWKVPDLSAFCSGEASGFQFATPYAPDRAGIHPIFYNAVQGLPNDLPREWLAEDLRELELVLCGGSSYVLIQTCSYQFGGKVQRWQDQFRVEMLEARTGKSVASYSYEGPVPKPCPEVISSDQKYYGSGLTGEEYEGIRSNILEYMEQWVVKP